jgi:hypothetical protein
MSIEDRAMEELARIKGISVTALRMQMAAPTSVIQAIVRDNRHQSHSTSLLPPKAPSGEARAKGSGWATPVPLAPPEGIALVDKLCDAQDALDRRDLERKLKGEG